MFQFEQNMLINGDNLDGLKLIEGLVDYDLILIDPPYRTGNKNFVYSDDMTREAWSSHLQERLKKAHSLLKNDGAIAIHIDDKEYATLRLLMDNVFGEDNYVNTFILKRGNKNLNNQFKRPSSLNRAFEFLVVYKKSDEFYYKNPYKESSEKRKEGYWEAFKAKSDRPTMRYPIDGIMISEGQWKWSKDRGLRALQNYKEYKEKHEEAFTLKEYWETFKGAYSEKTGKELEFVRRSKNSAQYWVKPSDRILMDTNMMEYYINDNNGKKKYGFDTVKNLDTVKKIISIFTDKDSRVLDFYAGSGTTGHAVMELNREDGGNRQFTLMTNDENNICSTICKPRISEVAKSNDEKYQYIVIG